DDGIRAFHVTGVQTCALPISRQHALALGRREVLKEVADVRLDAGEREGIARPPVGPGQAGRGKGPERWVALGGETVHGRAAGVRSGERRGGEEARPRRWWPSA